MSQNKIQELTGAIRAEKNTKVQNRMIAVRGVLKGHSTKDIADVMDVEQRTVQLWMARFNKEGLEGLQTVPGQGRPRLVSYKRIETLANRLCKKNKLTPRKLQNEVRSKLGCDYSLCNIRKILCRFGFSAKRSTTEYSSAADPETVEKWQKDLKPAITGSKRRRRRIIVQDESVFIRVGTNGKKFWSHIREPVSIKRGGKRDKVVAYFSLADDGTRLMRQYDKFDTYTFIRYLEEVRRKWGKCLIILDNASQHKSKAVREYLERHKEIELLFLPTATPKLNAVEAVWKDAKYRLVTSAHYTTLEDLSHAVSEYFRTCVIRFGIYDFLYRSI